MNRGIKAVFYDSATNSFVKLYPDQITEVNPNYTPIGVEVIPAEHDVYGDGTCGIMSLAEISYNTPDTGTNTHYEYMCWGGYGTDTSLPNYDTVNHIGTGNPLNGDVVQGTNSYGLLPSDQYSTVTSLDGKSSYYNNSSNKYAPSPYNADGSRNEAYYTTAYSIGNSLSDFDGMGNTKVLTELATAQGDWKTASTIANRCYKGYYPAACCAWRFHTAGTDQGQWYLPACGEFGYVINRFNAINETINKIKSVYTSVVAVALHTYNYYWSSSEYSANYVRRLYTRYGSVIYSNKYNYGCARAFIRL